MDVLFKYMFNNDSIELEILLKYVFDLIGQRRIPFLPIKFAIWTFSVFIFRALIQGRHLKLDSFQAHLEDSLYHLEFHFSSGFC